MRQRLRFGFGKKRKRTNGALAGSFLPAGKQWRNTFNETFTSQYLDETIWKTGQHTQGMAGEGAFDVAQITLQSGILSLGVDYAEGYSFNGTASDWASSELTTYRRTAPANGATGFKQLYGYFEAKMKYSESLPNGAHPAFWLMPDRGNTINAAHDAEFSATFLQSALPSSPITSAKVVLTVNSTPTSYAHAPKIGVYAYVSGSKVDPLFVAHHYKSEPYTADEVIEIDLLSVFSRFYIGSDVKMLFRDVWNTGAKNTFASVKLVVNGVDVLPASTTSPMTVGSSWGGPNNTHINSPAMEIDIHEGQGYFDDDEVHMALHWNPSGNTSNGGYNADKLSVGDEYSIGDGQSTTDWHVYGVNWQPGRLDFYIDGNLKWTREGSEVSAVASYILLSMQANYWLADMDDPSVDPENFPVAVEFDWVRAYEIVYTKAPVNSAPPAVSGSSYVGGTLTATSGTWVDAISYAYQWLADGVEIDGATSSTFANDDYALEGASFTCRVTATNPKGSTSATSNEVHLFVPADIAHARHYDAKQTDTVTIVDSKVAAWQDLGAIGDDLAQADTALQPALTGGAIVFADADLLSTTFASNGLLQTASGHKLTASFVYKVADAAAAANNTIAVWRIENDTEENASWRQVKSDNSGRSLYGPRQVTQSLAAFTAGDKIIVTVIGDKDVGTKTYLNGTQVGSLSTTTFATDATRLEIGRNFSEVNISTSVVEFIAAPSYASLETVQKLDGYLAHKNGLLSLLPSDHPYKTNPPVA